MHECTAHSIMYSHSMRDKGASPAASTDFSEQALFLCDGKGASCRSGSDISAAIDTLSSKGLQNESCLPYSPGSPADLPDIQASCPQRLASCPAAATGFAADPHTDDMLCIKHAISRYGTVVTGMSIYPDFNGNLWFSSQPVYSRKPDMPETKILGAHAVAIVGWIDAGGYWLVTNSWGPDSPTPAAGGVAKVWLLQDEPKGG